MTNTTGDGVINALDLLAVKQHILGLKILSGEYAAAANVNYDESGNINSRDYNIFKRYLLGLY